MTAAQFFAAAKRADPAIAPGVARGDFTALMRWLRANIHGEGSRLSTAEIIVKATGAPLDEAIFLAHLRARYVS